MTDRAPEGRLRADRAARSGRARQRRLRIAEIVTVVVVGGLGLWYASTQVGDVSAGTGGHNLHGGASSSAQLVAISVTGASAPLVAVVGSGVGVEPAGFVLPPSLRATVPGQGEASVDQIAQLPADSMRVAVSNVIGGWTVHYAVLDLDGLGALVDRAGGITVNLADPVPVGGVVIGPGDTHLDGATAIDYLFTARSGQAADRFRAVLQALLVAPPSIEAGDLAATDDAESVGRILAAAMGARVVYPPTTRITGGTTVPEQPAFDEAIQDAFGLPAPLRAIVQNGSGAPGIGEAVGRLLIPAGFRIVLSQNAQSFDHEHTEVVADGADQEAAARAAREALGIGRVIVSQVPSGVGEITVVVGKDFSG